jgi:type I restriction enzyme M protein
LKPRSSFLPKYFYAVLNFLAIPLLPNQNKYQRHFSDLKNITVPLPPLDIQQEIVDEIEILEKRESENKEKVDELKNSIGSLLLKKTSSIKVDDIASMLKRGKSPKYGDSHIQIIKS